MTTVFLCNWNLGIYVDDGQRWTRKVVSGYIMKEFMYVKTKIFILCILRKD